MKFRIVLNSILLKINELTGKIIFYGFVKFFSEVQKSHRIDEKN
jgi:hypothetical protein